MYLASCTLYWKLYFQFLEFFFFDLFSLPLRKAWPNFKMRIFVIVCVCMWIYVLSQIGGSRRKKRKERNEEKLLKEALIKSVRHIFILKSSRMVASEIKCMKRAWNDLASTCKKQWSNYNHWGKADAMPRRHWVASNSLCPSNKKIYFLLTLNPFQKNLCLLSHCDIRNMYFDICPWLLARVPITLVIS